MSDRIDRSFISPKIDRSLISDAVTAWLECTKDWSVPLEYAASARPVGAVNMATPAMAGNTASAMRLSAFLVFMSPPVAVSAALSPAGHPPASESEAITHIYVPMPRSGSAPALQAPGRRFGGQHPVPASVPGPV
jgi:hypothetical protein